MTYWIRDLHFSYGNKSIFEGATISVEKGKVIGLVAPNGEGKTTLFDLMAGHIPLKHPGLQNLPKVTLVPQSVSVPGRLKIREYYEMICDLENLDPSVPIEQRLTLNQVEKERLAAIWTKAYGVCSGGERRWATLLFAMVRQFDVLLLDEPFNAVDPQYKSLLRDRILQVARQEKAVMISSHVLAEFENLADSIVALKQRKIEYFSSMAAFRQHVGAEDNDAAFIQYWSSHQ